jgi:hypothetical protein
MRVRVIRTFRKAEGGGGAREIFGVAGDCCFAEKIFSASAVWGNSRFRFAHAAKAKSQMRWGTPGCLSNKGAGTSARPLLPRAWRIAAAVAVVHVLGFVHVRWTMHNSYAGFMGVSMHNSKQMHTRDTCPLAEQAHRLFASTETAKVEQYASHLEMLCLLMMLGRLHPSRKSHLCGLSSISTADALNAVSRIPISWVSHVSRLRDRYISHRSGLGEADGAFSGIRIPVSEADASGWSRSK